MPTKQHSQPERPVGPNLNDNAQTIAYLLDSQGQLWRDNEGTGYITWWNRIHTGMPGPRWETYPLDSSEFHGVLQAVHSHLHGEGLSSRTRADIILKLQGDAAITGVYSRVWVRSAWDVDERGRRNICLDLGNHAREMVYLSHDVEQPVKITNAPYPKFRRLPGQQPLIRPSSEANSQQGWQQFVELLGFENEDQVRLIWAWMMAALWPEGPYPILSITGPPDSGKSTLMRTIRRLIDPQTPESTGMPMLEKDLVLTASQSRVLCLDNLSTVPPWASDALCRVSTGTGGHARRLNMDTEQLHLGGCCSTVMTGVRSVVQAPDLLSRTIHVKLPAIRSTGRVSEMAYWKRFERIASYVLGQLIHGIRYYLADISSENPMEFEFRPRMITYAHMAMVAEVVFGWEYGSFERAYRRNLQQSDYDLVDTHPAIDAIIRLADQGFQDGYTELLAAMEQFASPKDRRSEYWPANSLELGHLLAKAEPILNRLGYQYRTVRTGKYRVRVAVLSRAPKT